VSALDPYTTAALEQAREMARLRERAVSAERERDAIERTNDANRQRRKAAERERDAARAEAAAHLAALRDLRASIDDGGCASHDPHNDGDGCARCHMLDGRDAADAYLASIDGAAVEPGYARAGKFVVPVLTPEQDAALTRAMDAPPEECRGCDEPAWRCERIPAPDPRLAGFRVGDAIEVLRDGAWRPAAVDAVFPHEAPLAYGNFTSGGKWSAIDLSDARCFRRPRPPAAPEERPHAVGDRWTQAPYDSADAREPATVVRVATYEGGAPLLIFVGGDPAPTRPKTMHDRGWRRLPPAPVARFAVGQRVRMSNKDARKWLARETFVLAEDDGSDIPYRAISDADARAVWFRADEIEAVAAEVKP
jgi:hypothetical protein